MPLLKVINLTISVVAKRMYFLIVIIVALSTSCSPAEKKNINYSREMTGRISHNLDESTIAAIESYLSDPTNPDLEKAVRPFLDNNAKNNVTVVLKYEDNKKWYEYVRRHALLNKDNPVVDWHKCSIGTLRCGIGGTFFVSVVFSESHPAFLVIIPSD